MCMKKNSFREDLEDIEAGLPGDDDEWEDIGEENEVPLTPEGIRLMLDGLDQIEK